MSDSYCVDVHEIILEHRTSKRTYKSNQGSLKSADTCLYGPITSRCSCLFMFYSLCRGQRESSMLSFSGVCLEPSTDCF